MKSKNRHTFMEFILLFVTLIVVFLFWFMWQVYSGCQDSKTSSVTAPPVYYQDSESTHDYDDTSVGELECYVYHT